MALIIGDKVFRNLPEQVAYLQECVEQLNHDLINKEYSIQEINIVDGHLIFGLVNGVEIDAGVVRGITDMEIDASQHLIVNYDDGTSNDLGAIFSGNVNISGTLTALKLNQTQANKEFTPTLQYPVGFAFTDLDRYKRVAVINGILYIVALINLKNETGSTQTISGNVGLKFTVDAETASKIYTFGGQALPDANAFSSISIDNICVLYHGTDRKTVVAKLSKDNLGPYSLIVDFDFPTEAITNNENIWAVIRIPLTLI